MKLENKYNYLLFGLFVLFMIYTSYKQTEIVENLDITNIPTDRWFDVTASGFYFYTKDGSVLYLSKTASHKIQLKFSYTGEEVSIETRAVNVSDGKPTGAGIGKLGLIPNTWWIGIQSAAHLWRILQVSPLYNGIYTVNLFINNWGGLIVDELNPVEDAPLLFWDESNGIELKLVAAPIDGGWSDYGSCSTVSCGVQPVKTRTCTNPVPQYGGKACVGESTTSTGCVTKACAIAGGWSTWSPACNTTCGTAATVQTRECNNPVPSIESPTTTAGATCVGSATQTCAVNPPCPTNGGWSAWSVCDINTGTKTRICNNPAPKDGGTQCTATPGSETSGGGATFTETMRCDVPCITSSWGEYGSCSKPCGTGEKIRTRTVSQQPKNQGTACGPLEERATCNEQLCPIHGSWTSWGSCDQTCGSGIKRRTCTNPAPAHGGNDCTGSDFMDCNMGACAPGEVPSSPVDGVWSPWGTCQGSCGTGSQTRTCTPPKNGGLPCPIGSDTQDCQLTPCLSQAAIDAMAKAKADADLKAAANKAAANKAVANKAAANKAVANKAAALAAKPIAPDSSSDELSGGAIAGIVIACVGVGVIGGYAYYVKYIKK